MSDSKSAHLVAHVEEFLTAKFSAAATGAKNNDSTARRLARIEAKNETAKTEARPSAPAELLALRRASSFPRT